MADTTTRGRKSLLSLAIESGFDYQGEVDALVEFHTNRGLSADDAKAKAENQVKPDMEAAGKAWKEAADERAAARMRLIQSGIRDTLLNAIIDAGKDNPAVEAHFTGASVKFEMSVDGDHFSEFKYRASDDAPYETIS